MRSEKPVIVPGENGVFTEPEPDFAVTRETASSYFENNPGPQDVSLVVEVADSSLNFDLNTKALLYARVGIPEYWVMDINGRRLHRHRQPTHDGYRDIVIFNETESVSPLNRVEAASSAIFCPRPALPPHRDTVTPPNKTKLWGVCLFCGQAGIGLGGRESAVIDQAVLLMPDA